MNKHSQSTWWNEARYHRYGHAVSRTWGSSLQRQPDPFPCATPAHAHVQVPRIGPDTDTQAHARSSVGGGACKRIRATSVRTETLKFPDSSTFPEPVIQATRCMTYQVRRIQHGWCVACCASTGRTFCSKHDGIPRLCSHLQHQLTLLQAQSASTYNHQHQHTTTCTTPIRVAYLFIKLRCEVSELASREGRRLHQRVQSMHSAQCSSLWLVVYAGLHATTCKVAHRRCHGYAAQSSSTTPWWQQATTATARNWDTCFFARTQLRHGCARSHLQSQLRGRWPSLSGSCVGSGLCRVVAMGESSVPVAVVCTSVLGALLFVLGLKTSLRRQVRDRQLRAYHDACADTCACPCACVRACVHVCARDCTRPVHNSTGCSEKPGQGGSGESCCNEPCAWQHQ